jgi:hypothetical protein
MRLTGQMLSMGITMLLFAIFIGPEEIAPPHHGFMRSMTVGFAVFAAMCLVGIFASLARGRTRNGNGSNA